MIVMPILPLRASWFLQTMYLVSSNQIPRFRSFRTASVTRSHGCAKILPEILEGSKISDAGSELPFIRALYVLGGCCARNISICFQLLGRLAGFYYARNSPSPFGFIARAIFRSFFSPQVVSNALMCRGPSIRNTTWIGVAGYGHCLSWNG
jgi:hypothetical protein